MLAHRRLLLLHPLRSLQRGLASSTEVVVPEQPAAGGGAASGATRRGVIEKSVSEITTEDCGKFIALPFSWREESGYDPHAAPVPGPFVPVPQGIWGLTKSEEIPEGVCGEFLETIRLTKASHIMVRETVLQIVARLSKLANPSVAGKVEEKKSASEKSTPKSTQEEKNLSNNLMIDGARGVGKSIAMMHAVHYCRSNGWLVLFIPNPWEWNYATKAIRFGGDFGESMVPVNPRSKVLASIAASEKAVLYGQPRGAQIVLHTFRQAHGEQIKKIPQKRVYDHKLYQSASGAEPTLNHIVARGLSGVAYASEALYDLRMELSLVDEYPVLIAVDQINALYWPSCFYMKKERIHPDHMLLMRTFRAFDDNGLVREGYKPKRGALLSAVSKKHNPNAPESKKEPEVAPLVFPKGGNEMSVYRIQPYTNKELQLAMAYYHEAGIFPNKAYVESSSLLTLHGMLTGNIPERVFSRAYLHCE